MPAQIKPHIQQVEAPEYLRSLRGWLIWRFEQDPGEKKPRKVPYYANGGKRHGVQGRPEDRESMVTFEAARAAAARKGFDGIGLALLPDWKLTALDFDDCVKDGKVLPEVENLIAGTYAEYSPSGAGVRAFMRGSLGNRKSYATDITYGFETFATKGFVTFTGNRLEICDDFGAADTVSPLTEGIKGLYIARFGAQRDDTPADAPPLGIDTSIIEEALAVLDAGMGHDDWLRVGMAIHHETAGQGFQLWDTWSSKWGEYPGTYDLEKRWESFGRADGKQVTIRTLVKMANENGARIDLHAAVDAADFDDLTKSDITTAPSVDFPFKVHSVDEFCVQDAPTWIIKNVLPQADLGVLFGESGSGKSFAALDMAACVAQGLPWRGHKVKQGRVLFIAAEGASGFRKRLAAYCQEQQLDRTKLDIGIINAAPSLLETATVKQLAQSIKGQGGADLIFVDTLAQTMPGANENASEDVGKVIRHCRALRQLLGSMVVLIHHAGKDTSRGARGWSGLRAAADVEIEVVRDNDARAIYITKQKDGEDGAEFGFKLKQTPIGIDEDNEVITSCVVEYCDVVKASREPRGAVEKIVLRAFNDVISLTGEADAGDVIEQAVGQIDHEEGKRDTRRQRVMRAIEALIADGVLVRNGVKLAEGGEQ